ncbi:MAG: ABC transporter permease subunit [Rhodovarius sp.]|nr:ABC transporter permease subunit [Rhodovarius sp.]
MPRPIDPAAAAGGPRGFSRADLWAGLIVLALVLLLAEASRDALAPLPQGGLQAIRLDPWRLPEYALLTTARMLVALAFSFLFALIYATAAAKSRSAERLLIPLLDILQSVPILGFVSVTVVFFLSLTPGRMLGAELAAIFAIFTSQAWNLAFSLYQSLQSVPEELSEAARSFRLTAWARFWRLELPFAVPPLVWNAMMSFSGGWFFIVAAEAISVGPTSVALPGIGSWIALAIAERDLGAIGLALLAMLAVILACDQLLFRPLLAWADRFQLEQEASAAPPPSSPVLIALRRSRLIALAVAPVAAAWRATYRIAPPAGWRAPRLAAAWAERSARLLPLLLLALAAWQVIRIARPALPWAEFTEVLLLGLITMLRVLVLLALASLIWVPVGVWIGLRPRLARIAEPLAQFLAAFPANLLFPFAVAGILAGGLDPDIWLSPLMILGTQWYILFNVIAGAAAIPTELRDAAASLRLRGLLWWRRVALPAVFPFYVTGAITASGGAWNASIVAEAVSWGSERLEAQGLGAYIARATEAGDLPRLVLGMAVMSCLVVLINRSFWRPLYRHAEARYRLG